MMVNIDDIKVNKRVRKDLGDLEPLMDSLRTYGLMNPITITSKFELVAGERRLEAAKALGWTKIKADIIESPDEVKQLELELEENNQRKPFTDEELLEGYRRLDRLRNPTFFMKLWKVIKEFFKVIGKWFQNLFKKH